MTGRAALVAAFTVALTAGCGSSGPRDNGGARPEAAPDDGMAAEDEYLYGRAVVALHLGQDGVVLVEEPRLSGYVAMVGRTVAQASDRPEIFGGYTFGVLDDDEINAFAAPGGFVLVTRGAIEACDNEDELAAILAHEVAHVALGHPRKVLVAAGRVAERVEEAREQGRRFDLARVRRFLQTIFKGHERRAEVAADREAVTILAAAGYDPGALGDFLERLDDPRRGLRARLRSEHWRPEQRARLVRATIRQNGLLEGGRVAARDARFRNVVGGGP